MKILVEKPRESIDKLIMDTLTKTELNLENVRGQGYDGSGKLSGKIKGASTIILNKYPKATYVHCVSHVLSIAIVNACKIQLIQNIMHDRHDHIIKNMYIF